MVLLDPSIEIRAAAVFNIAAQHFANGTWIGIVPVGRHVLRNFTDNGESAAEEPLGSSHVPRRAEHRVH